MAARPGGGGHLGRHVVRIGQLLVVQMAALLRQDLVLDMDRAGARLLEGAHHVHDVQRLAVAGVAVDQHRQARGARDLADEEADLVDRDDAEIGQAHRGRHRRAGKIQRVEARGAGLQRRHAVVRARQLQDAGPVEQRAEALARGHGRQIGGDEIGHFFLPKKLNVPGADACPAIRQAGPPRRSGPSRTKCRGRALRRTSGSPR